MKALELNDTNTITKAQSMIGIKKIIYHEVCSLEFSDKLKLMRRRKANEKLNSIESQKRFYYRKAFEEICKLVDTKIIEQKKILELDFFISVYVKLLDEMCPDDIVNLSYVKHLCVLEMKLKNHYKRNIKILWHGKKFIMHSTSKLNDSIIE